MSTVHCKYGADHGGDGIGLPDVPGFTEIGSRRRNAHLAPRGWDHGGHSKPDVACVLGVAYVAG